MFQKLAVSLLSLISVTVFANTNFNVDSYDIYEYNITGDTTTEIIFIAKEKILLIAGDVSIPIKYKDGDDFYLTGNTIVAGRGGFNPSGKTKTTRFSIIISDANGDGINDMLLKPTSGTLVQVNGGTTKLPSSASSSSTFAGFENDGNTTFTPVSTSSGQAYKVARNGVTFFVDSEGNPFNISNALASATAVGNLKGNFTVSQGGAATYALPIDLVPGPAGIRPNVSVNYYSQGGNGLLGKGWNLSATESITRCKAHGRATNAPNYTGADTLCLNGDELVFTHNSGGYKVYRKRIDDGTVVHAQSSGNYKAYLENGTVKEFNQRLNKSGSSAVKAWYLSRVTQTGGANYTLAYWTDHDNGEINLTKITYGSHAVSFNYEERPDRYFGYDAAGAKSSRTRRLESISTSGAGENIARYSFKYGYTKRTDESFLTDIQKCVGSSCLEKLSFNWSSVTDHPFESTVHTETLDSDFNERISIGDIDGNGTQDIVSYESDSNNRHLKVYTSTKSNDILVSGGSLVNSWVDTPNGHGLLFLSDIDNDGVTDITTYNGRETLRNFLSNERFSYANAIKISSVSSSKDSQFADVNGDGVQEYVEYYSPDVNSSDIKVYRKNANNEYVHYSTTSFSSAKHKISFADVNGDGKSDALIFPVNNKLEVRFGAGTASSPSFSGGFSTSLTSSSIANIGTSVADINGDGLSDLIVADKSLKTLKIYQSTGSSFLLVQTTSITFPKTNDVYTLPNLRVMDINGDGRSDLVLSASYRPGLLDGTFGNSVSTHNLPSLLNDQSLQMADINGDGFQDIVRYQEHNTKVHIQKGTAKGLQILSILDGNKNSISVTYQSMAEEVVYQRAAPVWSEYGISASLNPSTRLVQKTVTNEGDTYYRYAGAQSSLDEGYLGFQAYSSVTGRDSYNASGTLQAQSIVSTTYLDQRPNFIGKSYQVFKRVKPDSVITAYNKLSLKQSSSVLGVIVGLYNDNGQYENLYEASVSEPITPLFSANYGNTSSASVTRSAPRTASGGNSGAVTLSSSASTFKQSWSQLNAGSSSWRPVLVGSSMVYYDPLNDSDIISKTTTETSYESNASSGIVRPSQVITTEGIGNYQKQTLVQFKNYWYAIGQTDPALMARALLSKQDDVTITAKGAWASELEAASLPMVETYTVNRIYNADNLLANQWVSGRAADELKTTYLYDNVGNVRSESLALVNGGVARNTTREFDWATGFLLSETNAEGHITTYADHDKYGNAWKITTGSATSPTQDLVTNLQFDDFGRQTKVIKPSGEVIETSYHNCNISANGCTNATEYKTYVKTTSNTGAESYAFYNTRGLNTKNIQKDFGNGYVVSTKHYDKYQRVDYTTAPREITTLGSSDVGERQYNYHDVLDQLVRKTDGAGGVTQSVWDYQGNGVNQRTVKVLVDGTSNYRDTVETYNALNQLVKVKAPNGSYTQFLYDLNGNVVRQWYSKANYSAASPEANTGIDKNQSHVIVKTYDKRSRLLSEIDPDKGETVYEYTPFGEVKTVKTPRAIAGAISPQTFAYDLLGRQTRTTKNDGSACYFYDESASGKSIGQLTETRYYKGTNVACNVNAKVAGFYAQQVYKYDSKGRLLDHDQFISGADKFYANYEYTATGQPLTKAWTGGDGGSLTVTYGYDSYSGMLTTVRDGSKTHWTLTDVDALGNATGVTLGSGNKVIKNYNANTGRMADVSVTSNTGTYASYLNYTYNKAGFVTNMTESAFLYNSTYSETYHYDDIAHRQLTSVDVTTGGSTNAGAFVYQYDALGNIRSSKQMGAYAYTDATAPHRVTTVNGKTYVYGNNDGNVTNDGRRSLIYGHNHLPTRISQGSGSSLRQSEYVYGADNGLLYRKDSVGTTVSQENWYFGDMQLTKKAGLTEKVYTIAEGVTLVIDAGSGAQKEAQYSVANNIGSTHIVLDENGFIKQRIMYDPFGKPNKFYTSNASTSIQDWSGFASKEGFTGHEHMYELDLIHMKGRVYDPTIGRFLQADLVVQAPGQILSYNRYAYVWNNPGAFTDPSGYVCGCPADIAESIAAPTENNSKSSNDSNAQSSDLNLRSNHKSVGHENYPNRNWNMTDIIDALDTTESGRFLLDNTPHDIYWVVSEDVAIFRSKNGGAAGYSRSSNEIRLPNDLDFTSALLHAAHELFHSYKDNIEEKTGNSKRTKIEKIQEEIDAKTLARDIWIEIGQPPSKDQEIMSKWVDNPTYGWSAYEKSVTNLYWNIPAYQDD